MRQKKGDIEQRIVSTLQDRDWQEIPAIECASNERRGLVAYLSDGEDAGSFRGGLELDDRYQVSYPDAVQAPDGLIYAVHDCDRRGTGEILLNVFSEDEILATQGA